MVQSSDNPLISIKPSDSGTTVSLHPLVLLTASDQITRHRLRGGKGPLVGILLGQQKGREITAEHAFPAALEEADNGKYSFKPDWLDARIQQYRDVHKAPALDAIGWFTLCPTSGPRPDFLPFQRLFSLYNETSIFLAIHPEAFGDGQAVNQKLPITVYECLSETDAAKDESSMQVDGEETSDIKFRTIPYTVETDEAEMIAINYVAKGAGSAAAVAQQESKQPTITATPAEPAPAAVQPPSEDKGKKRAGEPTEEKKPQTNGEAPNLDLLTLEEQDAISSIQSRLNSVKMLQTRLDLIRQFLQSLPPSYLTSQSEPLNLTSPSSTHLPHLRQIQALLTRLSLLTPPTDTPSTHDLEAANLSQSNDVALTQLLSIMNRDVQSLSELGKKFNTVDTARSNRKGKGGMSQTLSFAGMGGLDGSDARGKMGFGAGSALVDPW